jgi:c-di-GMP-binding flagellar brake protein YcgR
VTLLQTQYNFIDSGDSSTLYIVLAIFVAGVGALVVYNALSNRGRPNTPRRTNSKRVFMRTAREHGLDKDQSERLLTLTRMGKVRQPFLVFTNQGLLDDLLKRGFYALDNEVGISPKAREARTSQLFLIKRKLEAHAADAASRSSEQVEPGTEVSIIPEMGGRFPTRVLASLKEHLACMVPMDEQANQLRWKPGVRVKVVFYQEGGKGYSFLSKVAGYETVRGRPALLVKYSKTMGREQQRRHRRRIVERPCFVFPIEVTEVNDGKQTVKRAAIQTQNRALGTLIDISAGGAAIRSVSPVAAGRLVKVEFEFSRTERLAVFGKVKRVRPQPPRGGVMHLQFTRMSRQHLNQIHRYVYEFATAPPVSARQRVAAR